MRIKEKSKKELRNAGRAHRKEWIDCLYRGNRRNFSLTLVFLTLSSAGDILLAWILQQVFDVPSGVSDFTLAQIGQITAAFFAVFIGIEFTVRETNARFIRRAMRQYRNCAFDRIEKKSIASFQSENTSRYISALTADASSVETNYLVGTTKLYGRIMWFIMALALMLAYDVTLTIVAVGLSLVPVAISLVFGNRLAAMEKQVSERNEGFIGTIKDLLSGFAVIKSFQAEKQVKKLFEDRNALFEDTKSRRRKTEATINIISGFAGGAVQIGVFFYGAYLTMSGRLTMGVVIAFIQLTSFILTPVREIPPMLGNRKAALALIDKLADAVEENAGRTGTKTIEGIGEGIDVRGVTFGYNPEEPVLKNLSVRFEKGKSYAIVGGSGSGKTTLLSLLLGSCDTYEGKIVIGGEEIRTVASDSLYNVLSIIQQNVFIFDNSILDNITMFKDFPAEKLKSAIERAGLSELLQTRGKDYPCGENGSGLSGGEKQRISIARCLLKETPVLLMDEATAALDNKTASSVTNAILSIDGLTRIIVTHRLDEALLRRYDEIIVLHGGIAAEQGKFNELMARKGYFYSLYNVAQ